MAHKIKFTVNFTYVGSMNFGYIIKKVASRVICTAPSMGRDHRLGTMTQSVIPSPPRLVQTEFPHTSHVPSLNQNLH